VNRAAASIVGVCLLLPLACGSASSTGSSPSDGGVDASVSSSRDGVASSSGESGCPSGGSSGTGDGAADLAGAMAVSAGGGIACALLSGGTVECWGANTIGELGAGSSTGPDVCGVNQCSTTPVAVSGLSGVTAISVGATPSACALLSGGTVECWGDNTNGELGDGTTAGSDTPVAVSGLSDVRAISVGVESACALLSGGTVECWGDDEYGVLGSTTGPDNCTFGSCSTTPVAVAGLNDVTTVSVGSSSACALLSGGTVECWGDSTYGELGNGSTTGPDTCHHAVFSTLGAGSADGPCSTTPVAVTGLTDVTAISVGVGSACAVLSGGTVQCWGLGYDTMTSSTTPVMVTGLTGVTAISVGEQSACAVLSGGTVECWGDNSEGELGNGTTTGPANCADASCRSTPGTVSCLTGATAVSVDSDSACALLSGGTVQCWGRNELGQLGNGTATGPDSCNGDPCSTTPVAVQ
jgi:alpha-tubulin suppressor-like RCC1 family protein